VRVEWESPVDEKMWGKFFDHTGRLAISTSEVKEAIFHGVPRLFPHPSNGVDVDRRPRNPPRSLEIPPRTLPLVLLHHRETRNLRFKT
jgi:hypothetical protein